MKGTRLARPLRMKVLSERSEIVTVITYEVDMGIQLLTNVRKTSGQNLILTTIDKVFQSRQINVRIHAKTKTDDTAASRIE